MFLRNQKHHPTTVKYVHTTARRFYHSLAIKYHSPASAQELAMDVILQATRSKPGDLSLHSVTTD